MTIEDMNNDTTRFWIVFTLVFISLTGLILGFMFYPLATSIVFIYTCVITAMLIIASKFYNS